MTTDIALNKAEQEALNLKKGREASQAAKKARAKRVRLLLNLLQEVFPDAFAAAYKPLKCNITSDIHDYLQSKEYDLGALSKKCLRDTLHFYTSRVDYHKACLAPDAMRVDLKGNAVSPVTDNEKSYHQQRLESLTALQKKWADQKAKKNKSHPKENKAVTQPPINPVLPQDAEGRPILSSRNNNEKG